MRIYFLLQEFKAQGEGRLVLELESSAGDLKDTLPAEGEGPTVGAVNQDFQLGSQKEGKGHTGLMGLLHPQGEHAAEVVTPHSQDDSVD